MKIPTAILLFLLFYQCSIGQQLDFDKIQFRGLHFFSTKSQIIKTLGNPNQEFEPQYDCGGLSEAWQGAKYYTLKYQNVKFTGNNNEKYLIEEVDFKNESSVVLLYEDHILNRETTVEELVELFGRQIKEQINQGQGNGQFTVLHEIRDDGIILETKDGKLIRFRYWTAC
ncbi:hypothetical protein [Aquimarina brevivitae]|uniref:Uncharacterized protein n=1 Tax=Aquimarina brevivitae TaxID=323412 RepID=A0A4Q7PHL1_9FLAO|nr:hypothetical protein [Aquimarina brevivitae]RZT00062.1 hypothetical protein EV197_1292 [Aquimarina brevivitae]